MGANGDGGGEREFRAVADIGEGAVGKKKGGGGREAEHQTCSWVGS